MCTWRDQEATLADETPFWSLLPSPVPENGMSSGTGPWCLIHGPFPCLWGKQHVRSILEPASGDGMIYTPQSRQGLDFSCLLEGQEGAMELYSPARLSAPQQDLCLPPALRPACPSFKLCPHCSS